MLFNSSSSRCQSVAANLMPAAAKNTVFLATQIEQATSSRVRDLERQLEQERKRADVSSFLQQRWLWQLWVLTVW
jgi:hypothetical protein